MPPPLTDDRAKALVAEARSRCTTRSGSWAAAAARWFLYQRFKGEASTPEMQRGKAVHVILERAVKACVEAGESTIPPELVKAIAAEVLAETSVSTPIEEHDAIREMVYRWGSEFALDPSGVVACETLFVLDVDGFEVRCRVDYAELLERGAAVAIRDWKTAKGAPSFDEIARTRPDGTLMARSFQLILYALALAYGRPVREEWCAACDGVGIIGSLYAQEPGDISTCEACGGKRRHETVEPFGVADRAQRFDLAYVYPAIEDREGRMLVRAVSLTRLELEEYRDSLRGLVARVRAAEASGDWPATASDAGCSECPAPGLCPIPRELRDHRGTINTLEQASEAAERLYREKAEHAARQRELREFAKSRGVAIPFGRGMAMDFVYSESERIADKDAVWDAVDRAVRYGESFDRGQHVKTVKSTSFKAVSVEADGEEGSDGSE
jgi:hypothetical protein